jgi:chromosome segregation ATPase
MFIAGDSQRPCPLGAGQAGVATKYLVKQNFRDFFGQHCNYQSRMTREDELTAELERKDADLAKAKRMMVALNNKCKARLAGQEAKMKEEGDRFRVEIEELKLQLVNFASKDTASQISDNQDLGAEIGRLQEAIAERDAVISERDEFIAMAKEKFLKQGEKARALIQDRDEQIALKEQEIIEVNEKLVALQSSLDDLGLDTDVWKSKVSDLEEKLREAHEATALHQASTSANAVEAETLEIRFSDLSKKYDALMADHSAITDESKALADASESLKQELATFQARFKEAQAQESSLRSELELCLERTSDAEAQVFNSCPAHSHTALHCETPHPPPPSPHTYTRPSLPLDSRLT